MPRQSLREVAGGGGVRTAAPDELSGGQAQRVAIAARAGRGSARDLAGRAHGALDVAARPPHETGAERVLAGRTAVVITHDDADVASSRTPSCAWNGQEPRQAPLTVQGGLEKRAAPAQRTGPHPGQGGTGPVSRNASGAPTSPRA
ncbi:hypothetical protein QJS66_16070 [Kocuria rhizophila]|nr:hypothetical protein QJS66_16070 [Kocuria rhizophila]